MIRHAHVRTRRAATALAVTTCALAARAQPPPRTPYRLVYPANAAALRCPEEAAFRERVADLLGDRAPFSDGAADAVEVELTRSARGVRGAWRVRRGGASRSEPRAFTGVDCGRVVDDLVRSVGIVLDPLMLMRAAAPRPSAPTPAPAPTVGEDVVPQVVARERPPPVMLDAPAPPPPAPSGPAFSVALGGGAAVGAVSTVSPVVEARVTLAWSRLSLSLDLRGDLGLSQTSDAAPGAAFRSTALAGLLAPCVTLRAVSLCALAGGGAVHREATGVASASASLAPMVWVGARVGVAWRWTSSWSLFVHADALAAVLRAVPTVRGVDEAQPLALWDPPPVHGALGVDVTFTPRGL